MDEPLKVKKLAVGDTRPSLVFGLPLELAITLFITSVEVAIYAGLRVVVMIPFWWGLTWLVRKDYNAARVIRLWCATAALDFSVAEYGGYSVNPLPIKTERRFRGISK